jgi:hypothetical protein
VTSRLLSEKIGSITYNSLALRAFSVTASTLQAAAKTSAPSTPKVKGSGAMSGWPRKACQASSRRKPRYVSPTVQV